MCLSSSGLGHRARPAGHARAHRPRPAPPGQWPVTSRCAGGGDLAPPAQVPIPSSRLLQWAASTVVSARRGVEASLQHPPLAALDACVLRLGAQRRRAGSSVWCCREALRRSASATWQPAGTRPRARIPESLTCSPRGMAAHTRHGCATGAHVHACACVADPLHDGGPEHQATAKPGPEYSPNVCCRLQLLLRGAHGRLPVDLGSRLPRSPG
jgi:hypothetical protein